mmetsp:Transcript_22630/g.36465  ORF Transcript_22630/g.36465 Transcript_22630/m.36465 type:complete len:549 (-) Transcript_22630:295-1941(-)
MRRGLVQALWLIILFMVSYFGNQYPKRALLPPRNTGQKLKMCLDFIRKCRGGGGGGYSEELSGHLGHKRRRREEAQEPSYVVEMETENSGDTVEVGSKSTVDDDDCYNHYPSRKPQVAKGEEESQNDDGYSDASLEVALDSDGFKIMGPNYGRTPSPCTYFKCNCEGSCCENGFPQRRSNRLKKSVKHVETLMGMKATGWDDSVSLHGLSSSDSEASLQWHPAEYNISDGSVIRPGYTEFVNRTSRRLARKNKMARQAAWLDRVWPPSTEWLEKRAAESARGPLLPLFSKYQKKRLEETKGYGLNCDGATMDLAWTPNSSVVPRIALPKLLSRYNGATNASQPPARMLTWNTENMTCCEMTRILKGYISNSTLARRLNVTYESVLDTMEMMAGQEKSESRRAARLGKKFVLPQNLDDILLVPPNWEPGPNDLWDYRYPIPLPLFKGKKLPYVAIALKRPPVHMVENVWPAEDSEEYKSGDSSESMEAEDGDVESALINPVRKRRVPKRRPFDAAAEIQKLERRREMTKAEKRALRNPMKLKMSTREYW